MNLMIVDDEPLEREVLTRIIKQGKLGIHQFVQARNGMDAVRLAQQRPIDLVLMDMEMPVMDGMTAATIIKEIRPACPIIFFTVNSEFQYQNTHEFLLKPAHPADIIKAVLKYIPVEKHPAAKATAASKHRDIITVMEYIKENLHLDLSLDCLAELVHFNGQYLSRLFKQETNCTLTQYITSCRLEKAKHYLSYSSEDTVLEISRKCGFTDSNYFARVFKKYEGLSPSQYQQQALSNRKKRINAFNNLLM